MRRDLAPGATILAVSFAVLIDEIMLSAIFQVLLGAGNTVAAIAIALIGLSSAGIVAYLAPAFQQPERANALYRTLLFWFGVSLMVSTFLIMSIPVSHGDFIYAGNQIGVVLARLAIYHVAVAPFFFGGLVINAVLRSRPGEISRLYFCDLAGAALGCAASPVLLTLVGAPRAILYSAVPALVLGSWSTWPRGMKWKALAMLPVLLVGLGLMKPELHSFRTLNTMGEVHRPRYRSFALAKGDIDFEKWALDAWTIIRNERIPQQWEAFKGWGLSPTYQGPIPKLRLVNYNARFSTYVTAYDGRFDPIREWLDADLTSLHYLLGRHYQRVLNIGAGGGREVLNALNHGASDVVAVDVSAVVVNDIMKGRLREFSGDLYLDPRVTAVADEGRSFTERSQETFDLIDFSIVGGMNLEKMDLVRSDDLFTLEAVRTYLGHLDQAGVFSYVMYTMRSDLVEALAQKPFLTTIPYIPALRTLTGLRIAFAEAFPGRRFEDHVLIAGLHGLIDPTYDLVHIIASESPFSESERQRFHQVCDRLEFVAFYPARSKAESQGNPYASIVQAPDLPAFARTVPFSIWPPTDDKPFQAIIDPTELMNLADRGSLVEFLGQIPLVSLGVSIGALGLAVTLIPLAWLAGFGDRGGAHLGTTWSLLFVFAAIGYGYMAIEIVVLLKLQRYLGNPIYGLSVGLFAFLLSSGLGSASTQRVETRRLVRTIYRNLAFFIVLGLVFFRLEGPAFQSTISAPLPLRIGLAVAAIFPLAFLMGSFFPMGIRLIVQVDQNLIPWAWGINGCLSVLGVLGTRISAFFLGFNHSLLIGLLVYTTVALFVLIFVRTRPALVGAVDGAVEPRTM
jgi:hypothetical protein